MRGHLQGVVQASGATIVPEPGYEPAELGSLANLGTRGPLWHTESRPVCP
jgi:hypothetical protein